MCLSITMSALSFLYAELEETVDATITVVKIDSADPSLGWIRWQAVGNRAGRHRGAFIGCNGRHVTCRESTDPNFDAHVVGVAAHLIDVGQRIQILTEHKHKRRKIER